LLAQAGKSGDEELTADEFHLGVPVPRTPLDFAWLALVEFAVGAALGLGVLAVLSGLQMAGNLIDQQVGVSLGEVFNPEFEINASLSGQLLHQLGLVVFLIIGGHLLMVSALVDTFTALPVGYAWVSPPAVDVLRDLVFQSLVVAVRVSAPIMAVMAVVGLAMGILGHTIPQINILVLGFPVRTLTGLVVLGLALGGVAQVMAGALSEAISRLREVLIGL
jgi:flagellar biosynthetic protein FliR